VWVLGAGGILLGLLYLLIGKPDQRQLLIRTTLVPTLVLTLAAALTALLSRAPAHWLPLAGLAAVCAGLGAASSPVLGAITAGVAARLKNPRWQGAVLLLASLIVVLGATLHAEKPAASRKARLPAGFGSEPMPLHLVTSVQARTDRGRPVPVFQAEPHHLSLAKLRVHETGLLQAGSLTERIIRTGPPDPVCNCHGWIFTGGRYWVETPDAERILQDNGYHPVSTPRPHDLVIYRDDRGQLAHSGIVRLITDDGLVLVESKWGALSRYLHPADVRSYGSRHTFQRSNRPGHVLAGLDYPAP
jgi:hypothetical protein